MIQITFAGTAAELREEMLVLLGIDRCEQPATPEPAPVEATDDEPKRGRGRGRPRKFKTDEPEVQSSESVSPVAALLETPEAQAAVTAAAEKIYADFVEPEPEHEPEPTPERVSTPVPGNAQDMMSAAMEIVKGDSGKKMELVKLLQSYGAKTINTLAPEHYAEFWVKVNQL